MRRYIVTVCALALSAGAACAQDYPTKPVRMLVGFPPGGPTDLTARLAAQHLSEALGQQVIVDNRPGAGGTVSMTSLTQAPPDGYTLALGSNGEMAISPNLRPNLAYDPVKSVAPISRIGASQLVLVVHPSLPVKTVKALIALAKARPGAVNFASAGVGSTAQLASELLKHTAAIDIVHIPYKGAGPALTELMGGQVQMLITGFSGAAPHVKAGRLRALGVTGAKRMVAMPELPTIGETVPGYEVTSWYGIVAPAGTPQAVVGRLHRELAAMTKKPEIAARLVSLGIEPEGSSPEEFAAQIRTEIAKWAKVIKLAGVKLD
ncbi:MAG: tripartite tricarboxylate transporter substrate binding protein [Betaproteobacteria bacterium]|nr:MAG: tripartite tricarboxylate transporter substrate binding protein [Betaproteobacteria bacterium]